MILTIDQMGAKVSAIRSAHTTARADVMNHTAALEEYHVAKKAAEDVATVVSEASQAAQKRFGTIVASVVTRCLDSVYPGNPYEFKIEFRESAGKTVVDTFLYRDGDPLDPMSSTGGGVWDVLAFALRVSMLILTAKDDTRKLLGLDEPFKFLHGAEKIRRAYETMESVGKEHGITIFCVRQH